MSNLDVLLLIMSIPTITYLLNIKKTKTMKLAIFILLLQLAYLGLETLFENEIYFFNRPKINLLIQFFAIISIALFANKRQLLNLSLISLLGLVASRLYPIEKYQYFFSIYIYTFIIAYTIRFIFEPLLHKINLPKWMYIIFITTILIIMPPQITLAQGEILELSSDDIGPSVQTTTEDEVLLDTIEIFISDIGLDKNSYKIYSQSGQKITSINNAYSMRLYAVSKDLAFVFCNEELKIKLNSCNFNSIHFENDEKVRALDRSTKYNIEVGKLEIDNRQVFFIPLQALLNANLYSDLTKLLSNQENVLVNKPIIVTNRIDKDFLYTLSFSLWTLIFGEIVYLNRHFIRKTIKSNKVTLIAGAIVLCIATIGMFVVYHLRTVENIDKIGLFNQKNNYLYNGYLIYNPQFKTVANKNYTNFKDTEWNNYVISANSAEVLAELVINNYQIKQKLITQEKTNYIYIPYNELPLNRVFIVKGCTNSDPSDQLRFENGLQEIGLNTYYIDEFDVINSQKKILFRNPGCGVNNQPKQITMDTNKLNIPLNNDKGTLIKLNNISNGLADLKLYDLDNQPLQFEYIKNIIGKNYYQKINNQDINYITNYSVIKVEKEFIRENEMSKEKLLEYVKLVE